jgi:AbrB family looped-hinge helix DNA binding protein
MKATGIVRRIDDLGRVVIPKEIRRSMRVKEGDPLEIYTTNDGGIVFKKYVPMGQEDWTSIGSVLKNSILQGEKFALYDRDLELKFRTSSLFEGDGSKVDSAFLATVRYDGDTIGYLACANEEFEPSVAVKVISAMYGEMVG